MANRHFGKLSDVWKHAALAEALDRERPRRYAETHAGSGAYPMVRDAERQFGIARFLNVAAGSEALARSKYRAVAASWLTGHGLYPGSALLAMTMLGDESSYLLCDLDRGSAADLRRWARELGLHRCYPDQHALHILTRPAGSGQDRSRPAGLHVRSATSSIRVPELDSVPSVVLASEQLDGETGWRMLAPGELVHVRPDLSIESAVMITQPPTRPVPIGDQNANIDT